MREAIERVIDELQERKEELTNEWDLYGPNPETYGRGKELERAIQKIKAVLNDET